MNEDDEVGSYIIGIVNSMVYYVYGCNAIS